MPRPFSAPLPSLPVWVGLPGGGPPPDRPCEAARPRLFAACLLPMLAWVGFAAGPDQPLYQGKPLDFWLAQLKDDDALAREEAIAVLADAGPAAETALPALK